MRQLSEVSVHSLEDASFSSEDSASGAQILQDPQVRSEADVHIAYNRIAGFQGRWLDHMFKETAAARNAQAHDLNLSHRVPRTAVAADLLPYVNATRWPHDYSTAPAHLQQLLRSTGAPFTLVVDCLVYSAIRRACCVFLFIIYIAFGVCFITHWIMVWIHGPDELVRVFGTTYMLLGGFWAILGLILLYFHCCRPCRQHIDIYATGPHALRIHILALHLLYAADRVAGSRGAGNEATGGHREAVAEMDIPVRMQNNAGYLLHKHTVYSDGAVVHEREIVQDMHWDDD